MRQSAIFSDIPGTHEAALPCFCHTVAVYNKKEKAIFNVKTMDYKIFYTQISA